eukprot:CAMPEP_0206447114 /NCGR_PEP_ID=MMETSP0324_2-20121206/16578_1 /ASSEMBLY_ACC=CAM_ASM_000836 /TAXON_ID=2866 /ORGANISM="Crypthecodinium cohnii, Strain Seligo" /LENGTH=426 /DNA_ID=CAMNT_0053915793 /DNA_START=42 /DNA_END=1323 /DNA_ORIENTATION=-
MAGMSWVSGGLVSSLLLVDQLSLLSSSAAATSSSSSKCDELLAKHVELAGPMDVETAFLEEAVAPVREMVRQMERDEAIACADRALASNEMPLNIGNQWARLAEQIALHPSCLGELKSKSEAEIRCAQLYFKIGIHALQVVHEVEAAEAMWKRALAVNANEPERARIRWPTLEQTPTVYLSKLESSRLWDCSNWPFIQKLEALAPELLEEVQAAESRFSSAYPYLKRDGSWQNLFLHRGHEWDEEVCAALPLLCSLLKPELPTRVGVPYATRYNEEVVIFRSQPGASVGAHCGSSNAVINLHLTLAGGKGTTLRIGDIQRELSDGKVFCFQDSYFHAVDHSGGPDAKERFSIVVRVMHPNITEDTFSGCNRTEVVADLKAYDRTEALEKEVERLREAYRTLADQTRSSLLAKAETSCCEANFSLTA